MSVWPVKTALIVIDVQKGLDAVSLGRRNNPQAESNIRLLLHAWRETGRPVIIVQHASRKPDSTLRPDQPGFALKDGMEPHAGEPLIVKNVNSAFTGTGLEDYLHKNGIGDVVLVGLITAHCVSTTARMAANLGFGTWVVADATATFEATGYDGTHFTAEQMHAVALAELHGEFATVVTTAEVIRMAAHGSGAEVL